MSGNRSAASVAGRPIRLSEVEERAARLRDGPGAWRRGPAGSLADDWILRWAVQQLVGEALLDHEIRRAAESGGTFPRDAAIRRLVRRVTDPVGISEQDVRTYYERNLDRYRCPERRRVSYVAVAKRADAVRAATRLLAGGTETFGGDDRHGEMELRRGEYVGAFELAVFVARVGDVVGPMRSEHGWLVARIDGITAAANVPYGVARPAIAHELLEVARARAFDGWLELRRRELSRVAPHYEHPAHPLHGQPRHRH